MRLNRDPARHDHHGTGRDRQSIGITSPDDRALCRWHVCRCVDAATCTYPQARGAVAFGACGRGRPLGHRVLRLVVPDGGSARLGGSGFGAFSSATSILLVSRTPRSAPRTSARVWSTAALPEDLASPLLLGGALGAVLSLRTVFTLSGVGATGVATALSLVLVTRCDVRERDVGGEEGLHQLRPSM